MIIKRNHVKKVLSAFIAILLLLNITVVEAVKAYVPEVGTVKAQTVKGGQTFEVGIDVVNEKVYHAPPNDSFHNYDKWVLYTWEYGLKTDTPGYGTYIIVDNGVVTKCVSMSEATDKVDIPVNGYVIYRRHSNNDGKPALTQLYSNFKVGQAVTLTGNALKAIPMDTIVPKAAVAQDNKSTLKVDLINKARAKGKVAVYTKSYGFDTTKTTGDATNSVEIAIKNNVNTKIDEVISIGVNDIQIPEGGYVISYTGDTAAVENIKNLFAVNDAVRTNLSVDYKATPKATITDENGNKIELPLLSINPTERVKDKYTLYKSEYGISTKTNSNGVEVIVENNKIIAIDTVNGNNKIPAKGYVISVESESNAALENTLSGLKVGSAISITGLPMNNYVGAVSNGTNRVLVNKVNGNRDADTVIVYTPDYGMTTKTGNYGVEIIVDKINGEYEVIGVVNGLVAPNTNGATIPLNGFVISTIDTSGSSALRNALLNNFTIGTKVILESIDMNPLKDVTTTITRIDPTVVESNGVLTGTEADNGYPGGRGTNHLVVYTPAYGHKYTGTNSYGTEVTIVDGKVVANTGFNSEIPKNGFVVSGHGTAKDWITANLTVGAKVTVNSSDKTINSVVDASVYIDLAQTEVNSSQVALDKAILEKFNAPLEIAANKIKEAKVKIVEANNLIITNQSEAISLSKEARKLALSAYYNTVESNKVEVRGVWHRPTEKTKEQVIANLDKLADANFNTLLLETFYHGYVIYPSEVADIRPEFKDIGFDLLQYYVEEGAKRGIAVHAWVEDFYVGNKLFANATSTGSPILDKHPEWAAKMKNGSSYLTSESGYMFMNAAMPEVQNYLTDLYKEIVNKYDVKGLQLDYIRYPKSSSELDSVGFDDYSRKQVKDEYGFDPMDITKAGDPEKWSQFSLWKQNNITAFVEKIAKELKGIDKTIEISTAVFGNISEAVNTKNQNWPEWIEKGYLDFISPMAYLDFPDAVKAEVKNMVDNFGQVNNYAGISPMFHKLPPIEAVKQIIAVRDAGARGVVFFDSKDLTTDQIQALKEGPFREKATLPRLTPEIIANDGEVKIGGSFDPLKGVIAIDRDGIDITSRLVILESNLDINKVGVYNITYEVSDNGGARAYKTIKITVKEKEQIVVTPENPTNNNGNNAGVGNSNSNLPTTGDVFGSNVYVIMALLFIVCGVVIIKKRNILLNGKENY